MMIDTHAHYDFAQFEADRHALIADLPACGISLAINVGTKVPTSRASVAIAAQYPHMFAAVGFHPHYAESMREKDMVSLMQMAQKPKVVAFGEIGLDYHHNHSPPDVQRDCFAALLAAASPLGLPFIIHCRDAFDDTIALLREHGISKGVIHSFSGDAAQAAAFVDMGLHIGINGVCTFPKTEALADAIRSIPRLRILLETDCPYLAPKPVRGKRNDSTYLVHIAVRIAEILETTPETIAEITTQNAIALFGLRADSVL